MPTSDSGIRKPDAESVCDLETPLDGVLRSLREGQRWKTVGTTRPDPVFQYAIIDTAIPFPVLLAAYPVQAAFF